MVCLSPPCNSSLYMGHRIDWIWLTFPSLGTSWRGSPSTFTENQQQRFGMWFNYADDIVKGCVASLDTAERSIESGEKKMGPAQLRIFNLGSTSPITVPTLVDILEKYLNTKGIRNIKKMPQNGDAPSPTPTSLQLKLSWITSLQQILTLGWRTLWSGIWTTMVTTLIIVQGLATRNTSSSEEKIL